MTAYFVAYGFLIACYGLGLWTRALRWTLLVGSLPLIFLIAFRGLVGTDTAQYLFLMRTIREQGLLSVGLEPVFGVLSQILMDRFHDPFQALVIISVFIALLMVAAGFWLEKVPLLFGSLVMPYYLLDMTMNGVRYGLAFAIVTLATGFLLRGRRLVFMALTALATLTQLSALLLAAGIWLLLEARLRTAALVVVLAVPFILYFGTYLDDKAAIYSDLTIISIFSGLGPLALSLAMLGALFTVKEIRDTHAFQIAALVAAAVLVYGSTQITSAGLRLQQLVLFLIYLYGAAQIYRLSVNVWRNQLLIVAMIFIALLSATLRLDNFAEDRAFGPTPFNPYYFIWNHYGFS